MRKKHSRYKNISWRKTRKEERKAKEKTSLFPKEDSLENKQARQRISPPCSANDLLASLAGWRVGNSRFSRGRKRIVDGTVRSLIPSESREELLAASYLLRSIELLLHLLLLLLSRPPPSSFHFCSFSSRFSPRSISSFSTLTPPRLVGRSVGVGIQRPHNRPPRSFCLVERHLGLRLLPRHLHLLLFFHLFLIQPGQPCPLLLFLLFFFFFLPSWSPIDKGMRPSPFSTQEKREAKRQGSVREEARRW